MEKSIGAFEARRRFGKILQEIAAKGDRVVVERHGQAVAAVIPIEVYEQWKQARREFFDHMRAVSQRANVAPEEVDQVVAEAVEAIRADPSG